MYMTVLSMWAEPLSEIMYFTNSLNIPRGELLTMKKATKASDNKYYQARFSAAQKNTDFESREAASDVVGIDRTRLARIELGNVTPYADEVVSMSKCYNAPELCYNYCSSECPIGRLTMKEVEINSFDRLSLKMLGSLNDIETCVLLLSISLLMDRLILENRRNSSRYLNPSTLFPIMRKPLNCGLRKTLRIFNGCILHNLP